MKCNCGWDLPAEGMRGALASATPIPTDLTVLLTFDCPWCGKEWDCELRLTYTGRADEPRPEPS